MTPAEELAIIRRAYALQIMASVRSVDERLTAAFAAVPREDFLGPGPWKIMRGGAYVDSPSADPVYLYTDTVVGIDPERHINNGQPSLHANLLAHAAGRAGEHFVHVGTGTGYYTALMSHIAGPSGSVTGIEFEPDLAARATANLAGRTNTAILQGDGATLSFASADVIYVNAGATGPADIWLDRLKDGGRLVLPLTTDKGFGGVSPEHFVRQGAVFLITRRGAEFLARWISAVAIYPCQGMRDADSERALAAAFAKGDWNRVTRLVRNDAAPEEQCWLKAPGWCLTY
jgi:protein-L-isoaspartate(D-aspartate) O-methyltransferase